MYRLFNALIAAMALLPLNHAAACRDCPFPSPIARLHWLMPSGNSEVRVDELYLGHGEIETTVRLIEAATGKILAIGKTEHLKGLKHLAVDLMDRDGGKIKADLVYMNSTRDKVRIRLKCEMGEKRRERKSRRCSVDELFLS